MRKGGVKRSPAVVCACIHACACAQLGASREAIDDAKALSGGLVEWLPTAAIEGQRGCRTTHATKNTDAAKYQQNQLMPAATVAAAAAAVAAAVAAEAATSAPKKHQ